MPIGPIGCQALPGGLLRKMAHGLVQRMWRDRGARVRVRGAGGGCAAVLAGRCLVVGTGYTGCRAVPRTIQVDSPHPRIYANSPTYCTTQYSMSNYQGICCTICTCEQPVQPCTTLSQLPGLSGSGRLANQDTAGHSTTVLACPDILQRVTTCRPGGC